MIWDRLFTKKESEQVSKHQQLKYTLIGDGLKPGVAPHGAIVRTPLQVRVPPGTGAVLHLGIKFDRTCLVFPHGNLNAWRVEGKAQVRISGVVGDSLLPPDTNIVFWVNNISDSELVIEDTEAVFDVIPLPDVDISKAK